ncbi:MAG TPA: DsbE family thiol:disulfide interchange protein [Thermohalobaculum sp.]|nr:DsbE family thiol:disulfide interchange protein [Thermohalobaculum sp.]
MTDETERDGAPKGGLRLWMLVPVLGAAAVLAVFLLGLQREDGGRELPSALIGKPMPEFALPPLYAGEPGLSTADMKAPGVKLVNVWASWCVPCRAEHPMIERLAEMGLTVHGLNYKDGAEGAKKFLAELGNPYARIGADRSGRVGIDWGVYGVPETFVIDGEGRIVYKHIGPIQGSDIDRKILPAVEKAQGG